MQYTGSHPAADGAIAPPRWTTVLGVGLALLVLFGLLGAVLAILLAFVRSACVVDRRRHLGPTLAECTRKKGTGGSLVSALPCCC